MCDVTVQRLFFVLFFPLIRASWEEQKNGGYFLQHTTAARHYCVNEEEALTLDGVLRCRAEPQVAQRTARNAKPLRALGFRSTVLQTSGGPKSFSRCIHAKLSRYWHLRTLKFSGSCMGTVKCDTHNEEHPTTRRSASVSGQTAAIA